MVKGRGKRPKLPSRIRYDEENPPVTFRLPKAVKARLYNVLEANGLTAAEFIQDTLEPRERATADLERAKADAREEGLVEGRRLGYEEAQDLYEVKYWCANCRRGHLSITSAEEKRAAADMMYRAGWHDPDCPVR